MEKKCTCCGVVKPIEAFGLRKAGHPARKARCKPCVSEEESIRQLTRGRRYIPTSELYARDEAELQMDVALRNFRAASAGQLTWRV